jgi:hypothetical protein
MSRVPTLDGLLASKSRQRVLNYVYTDRGCDLACVVRMAHVFSGTRRGAIVEVKSL